ncbi:MAG: acyl-CoA thioesterase [Acidimicrobiales bacterium]
MRSTFDPPTDAGAYRFCHQVRVRFAETDAMGIVHHAAYLPYLESARVEYLRAAGHPYHELRRSGLDLPVVEARARYLRPLYFDDVVDVHVVVVAVGGATLELGYLLESAGSARATAVTVHGVVSSATGRPVRSPGWLREMLAGDRSTALAGDRSTVPSGG